MKLFRSTRASAPPATAAGDANPASPHGIGASEARALLRQCCDDGVLVALMTNDVGAVCQGRLRLLDGDALFIELLDAHFRSEFQPLTVCCVMLNRGARAWAFLANVRSNQIGNGPPMISLQVPEHMTSAHGRTLFRIPLSEVMPVSVTVDMDGISTAVEAIDISLGGMRFTLPDAAPLPRENHEVTVHLFLVNGAATDQDGALSDEPIVVPSLVRHVSGRDIGVYFKTAMKDGRLDTPKPLRRLVAALEAYWLRTKIR